VRLTGERRIGKTSFLHQLHRRLAIQDGNEPITHPVFVDLEGVPPRDLFLVLIEEVVDALAVARATWAELRFSLGQIRYEAADFDHDLRCLVAELRRRTRQPVRLVLLIDEIDAVCEGLAARGDAWPGPLLGGGMPELRVVSAGMGAAAALDALELEPFTRHDAEALVREPVAGIFRFEPQTVEEILETSRRRPFAIQKLCQRAVDSMLDEGRTTVRVADLAASSGRGLRTVQCE
jgi:hypothetical protein